MKTGSIVRGGILAGVLTAILLASAGDMLGFLLPPWNWSSALDGWRGHLLQWTWAVIALAPAAVICGLVVALAIAVVFEFLTRRGGWLRSALIGLLLGTLGACAIGLVPWAASWYGYAYMPTLPPFGPSDPTWPLLVIVLAGGLLGIVSGTAYGAPLRADEREPTIRWRQVYPPAR